LCLDFGINLGPCAWVPTASVGASCRGASAQYIAQGHGWVIDLDLEKFFDRVNHDKLMGQIAKHPLSPLLSNLVLDELDRELENRGHRFVRYADDCNIYVRSERAGQRVMESISHFITQKLKLKVNEAKSAVARPQERKFLGF